MSTNTDTSSGGIGIAGALGIAFICLKLAGVINWSWWWVLSPFWISCGIFLVVTAIVSIIVAFKKP